MSTTTMHFGPEWMRTKHQPLPKSQPPPSPPPSNTANSGLSTYSALVSATPPAPSDTADEAHPFRYSKEDLLKIYQEGGGKGGLGLEVERWEGVVREAGAEPVSLRDMTEVEKKVRCCRLRVVYPLTQMQLFAGPINSELRRRPSQSTDYLSPLNTSGLDRPRLTHGNSAATSSPLRERFGAIKRRDSSGGSSGISPILILRVQLKADKFADPTLLTIPRKPSLSALQGPALSPREASPRTRVGYTPNFDGVLNSGESWVARRRASEASMKPANGQIREELDPGAKAGILEEKEDEPAGISRTHQADGSFLPSSSSPRILSAEPQQYVGNANNANNRNAFSLNGTTSAYSQPNQAEAGPPPGLVDLAAVEWSYKDPTGQVQGPFRADLMQKWFNDGYFSPDLPMKRTRYDTQWTTVEELINRVPNENIFLSPLNALVPTQALESNLSLQNYGSPDNVFHEPFQPAPIRTLRSSALESYLASGSMHSDSPSSSFGASQFGNPSPDPSAFGGRDSKGFFAGGDAVNRMQGFSVQDPGSNLERRSMGHECGHDEGHSFGNFIPERGIGLNGHGYNTSQDPWSITSITPSSGFGGLREPVSSNQHLATFGHDALQGTFNQGVYPNDNFNVQRSESGDINFTRYDLVGQTSFHAPQEQQQYASPMRDFSEERRTLNAFGYSPQIQHNAAASIAVQSSWNNSADVSHVNQAVLVETSQLPLATASQINPTGQQSSELVAEALPQGEAAVTSNLTVGNLGHHNQQQEQLSNKLKKVSIESAEQSIPTPSESVSVSEVSVPQPPTASAKASKESTQASPVARSVPAPADAAAGAPPKSAWAIEEEGKKKKRGPGPTISLREIQEAEAKKLEGRKAAEREKERIARASSTEAKEDAQPFTTSWGLPTSQTGARSATIRETPVPPAPPASTVPVWTTASKPPVAKKTMKEIQEEEKRKKAAAKEAATPAAPPKRAYAETTTKAPAGQNSAWTTVGPNGKTSATVAAPAKPPAPAPPSSTSFANTAASTSAPRATASPVQRAPNPALKTRPVPTKGEELFEAPSHDFLKWLSDSLKGLNSSVNVEEIVSMLLSFPLDPDSLTLEIISDTIYSNSTTLDGRRFASEFVAKRKADAALRAKGASGSKAPTKPVSIADVVKATPKPSQPEWGFKVVNKKKKGGRS
ncbi:hypothetical protein NLJ89_g912 [Agrocybe chaxingu]|uniref:GYF domain-containing protein n=1 Tax=Agrocybe chaxingu TaxID=84603 RepID=A0A9W8N132_9AGAR|nr:hypothetical protein NLJ89_g912 [Agrocybe chaxingu]